MRQTGVSDGEPTWQEVETHELEIHEALALLRAAPVGRLAVMVDDAPQIFPVNHLVDHGTVVFRTAAGTKLAAAHGRPIAFEVDGYDVGTAEAWSVVLLGVGRVVAEPEDVIDALGLPIFPWHGGAKPLVVRLVPHTITGRRFRVLGGARHR